MGVMDPIPQEWIRDYVDSLLRAAELWPEGSLMREAALLRADHAMDLVKSFRENRDGTGHQEDR